MIHTLKCSMEFFGAVASGAKPFEVRPDDRGFEVGDVLRLKECVELADGGISYTGRVIEKRVTYMLRHDDFPNGVPDGWCVVGLKGLVEKISAETRADEMSEELAELKKKYLKLICLSSALLPIEKEWGGL